MRRGVQLIRAACHAWLILLVLALSAPPSLAQSLVCHPLRRGESAGQAARRVTGDSRNTYLASFQIMNGASRFIPKSQYNRLHAGWRACVVRPSAPSRAPNTPPPDRPAVLEADELHAAQNPVVLVALAPPVAVAARTPISPRRVGNVDLTIVWLGAAIAVPWFGLQIVDGYLTRRKTAAVLVQLFANRFITEFERPLVRYDDAERPLKARVRRTRRGGFDILLAPGPGRRYPNLTDHKKNVEYDVGRVVHALDDHAFVNGAPCTKGEWVVVPFRPRTGPQQHGVTCISSF